MASPSWGSHFYIYGPRATEEVRWRGHNPFDLAENLRALTLWLGTADGLVFEPSIGETLVDAAGCGVEFGVSNASVSLHEKLLNVGIEHIWRFMSPSYHSTPNFQRQIKEALALFEQTFASPAAAPTKIGHSAIEPTFSVWNWKVEADPARALEFMTISNANASGLTLSGSGLTQVVSPPFYRGVKQVLVEGASPSLVQPDSEGRISFAVDLGPANLTQQFSPLADTRVETVTVNLRPQN